MSIVYQGMEAETRAACPDSSLRVLPLSLAFESCLRVLLLSLACLFQGRRDLLHDAASGRFAPSAAVVIFYYFGASVASLFHGMVQSETKAVLKAEKHKTIASL